VLQAQLAHLEFKEQLELPVILEQLELPDQQVQQV
jgi:hypothetical protein